MSHEQDRGWLLAGTIGQAASAHGGLDGEVTR